MVDTKKQKSAASTRALAPQSSDQFITLAIEKGASVETMTALFELREKVKAEAAREAFIEAMANFQAECPIIVKTKEVKTKTGMVAYRFAPIDSIVGQVKDLLKQNGFSYSTNMEVLSGGVKCTVKVQHILGHYEMSEMTVPLGTKTDIMSSSQVTAAASTFAKRYAFCNAFGILTGDEDTDASKESVELPTREIQKEQVVEKVNSTVEPITCSEAGCDVTEAEVAYSKRVYGRVLCRTHQQGAGRV